MLASFQVNQWTILLYVDLGKSNNCWLRDDIDLVFIMLLF